MFHLNNAKKNSLEGKDEKKYGCEDVAMDELDWLLKKQTCGVSLSGSLCAENRSTHIFRFMMIVSFLEQPKFYQHF